MSTASPIDVNEDVLSTSPEQKVFGRFFNKIPECLLLMKARNSFATGGAVLNAFAPDHIWLSTGIAFYVDDSNRESGARTAWESYLQGEGYLGKDSTKMVDGQIILYEHADSDLAVELFYVDKDPWWVLLSKMWMSAQLCVAAWDGMYCSFPESLINQKAIFFIVCSTPGQQKIREVFKMRGYSELSLEKSFDLQEFTQEHGRRIEDEFSQQIGFSSRQHGTCEELKKWSFRFGLVGVMVYPTEEE